MTNYFRVYIRTRTYKIKNIKVKKPEQVLKIINAAKQRGCISYMIQKYIKPNTEAVIAQGELQTDKEIEIPELYADWRIIDGRVVDWSKYPHCMKKNRGDER